MNAELAQIAALAAHARVRRLDSQLSGDDSYWERHSTFRYVRSVTFNIRKTGLFGTSERPVASTAAEWLSMLSDRADVFLLSFGSAGPLEAHISSAFANGTRNGIWVRTAGRETLWVSRWDVASEYPGPKNWAVTYSGRAVGGFSFTSKGIVEAREQLTEALSRISEFSSRDSALSGWRNTFEEAQDNLQSSDPIAPYHADILPSEGYSRAARQLLAASVAGFVFGGMGSWNDVFFSDRKLGTLYEGLTRNLYSAVMDGIVSAVNEGLST